MKLDFPDEMPVPKITPPPSPPPSPPPPPPAVDRKKVWQGVTDTIQEAWKAKEIYEDIASKVEDYLEQPTPWEKIKERINNELQDLAKQAISEKSKEEMRCKTISPDDPEFKTWRKFCDDLADKNGSILTNLKNSVKGAVERVKQLFDLKGRYEEILDDMGQKIRDFHG